jgi:hypothetical protein
VKFLNISQSYLNGIFKGISSHKFSARKQLVAKIFSFFKIFIKMPGKTHWSHQYFTDVEVDGKLKAECTFCEHRIAKNATRQGEHLIVICFLNI